MEITNVKVTKYTKGNTLGFASVELDGVMTITDIVIRTGEYGKYVKLPERKGSDDKYYPIVYVKQELKKQITEAVIKAL